MATKSEINEELKETRELLSKANASLYLVKSELRRIEDQRYIETLKSWVDFYRSTGSLKGE